jgi:tRNA G10  N-methylase Trm11
MPVFDKMYLMKSVFILGRQPALGRAELESLYGATALQPIDDVAVMCSLPASKIIFSRLGGSIKLAEIIDEVPSTDWRDVQRALQSAVRNCARKIAEGKIQLGISCFGFKMSPAKLNATGLDLKKVLRKDGRSVRLIPNQELALNSAQVLHNHLIGERGIELVIIRHEDKTVVARTVAEQDIIAYTERDRGRPKRDAFVGMLPPKLAQIIVNLAVGDANPLYGPVVLDPFCGTGVVLQEAKLMGFDIYGSDLQTRMVDYTDKNLMWLLDQPYSHVRRPENALNDPGWRYYRLEVGDATTHQWKPMPQFVACETYLGHPLSQWPTPEKLREIVGTCNVIIEKFMRNIGTQLKPGARLCLALPAWKNPNGHFTHLPLLDHLGDLGYNQVSFVQSNASELMYFRPDQIVARELLVITRK